MPRVSEEHLERRRQQILGAARTCFARKGFYDTSMQDVFAESGMSAGAVYRYFKSKNDIVAALATQTTVPLRALITEQVRAEPLPTPADLVGAIAEHVIAHSGPEGMVRLAPQAWALALVDPDAGRYVREAMTGIRGCWQEYAVRMRDAGWIPADADTAAVAAAIIGVLPGFILQHLLIGDVSAETLMRGIRTLMPYGETEPEAG
ncbi:TetR/AcrR family transcriptional regulator [Nocardia goodfellowii]|uniref:AcrR family transcriptional regulator n=1 Tax=Nocardia goodfellowii TaxID=882446 RepID=A0ABS4QS94_9NOCA|nr:TetR/AcrR family transcriptional regulator [Nocardia goodfellowii]MBP2194030.1 AcrR family transcriptional regulator [Nocardia goodfellowii]